MSQSQTWRRQETRTLGFLQLRRQIQRENMSSVNDCELVNKMKKSKQSLVFLRKFRRKFDKKESSKEKELPLMLHEYTNMTHSWGFAVKPKFIHDFRGYIWGPESWFSWSLGSGHIKKRRHAFPISSPGILLCLMGSWDAFRYLRALSAACCSIFLFLPGAWSPPPSSLFTSFSAFLLQVKTRSISCCIWATSITGMSSSTP